MTIKYYNDVVQGSDEWFEARRGLLTASEMKKIITPAKLLYSESEKEKQHLYELAAQRVSGFVEPSFIGDDMLRGKEDEVIAVDLYSKTYAEVKRVGFVTNDKWGFTLGYSPDGLVGEDGSVEAKSRKQSLQMEVLMTGVSREHLIQLQTGLLVSERQWLDYISFSGGHRMITLRVFPDKIIQDAIVAACFTFDAKLQKMLAAYEALLASPTARLIPTERRKIEGDMLVTTGED